MDYKEKYENALGWMRGIYPNLTGSAKEDAEHYFPELAESEDERIRKRLIEQVERWHECALENNVVQDIKDSADAITYLEKKKEQKPLSTEETELISVAFLEQLGYTCIPPSEQKPAEWSYPYGENETVDNLIGIAECLEMDGDCSFNGMTGTDCGKFLRDLAKREYESNPAEWSKEDEIMMKQLLAFLEDGKCVLQHDCSLYANWLKSLRPHWKPSEKQMKHLAAAIEESNNNPVLESLYHALKKLL